MNRPHLLTLRDGLAGLLVPSKIYGILAAGRATVYVGPDEGEIADILRQGSCGKRVGVGDAEGLVEVILGWPGIGPLLLNSILRRDVDLVTSAVLFSTVLLVVGNGLADLLLHLVDPLSRTEEKTWR